MGAFGGTYFRPIYSSVTGKVINREMLLENSKDWFRGMDIEKNNF